MNILYSEPILYHPYAIHTVITVVILILLVVFGIFIIDNYETLGIAICFIAGIMIIVVALVGSQTKPSGRKQYYVYFNDQASVEQIQEEYTLIEQKGSMYIIEDK